MTSNIAEHTVLGPRNQPPMAMNVVVVVLGVVVIGFQSTKT